MAGSRVVDSNMDGFSSNLFAVLVYYFEVGDVGLWTAVGNAVYVNYTGDITIVFFYSVLQTSTGFSSVRNAVIFFWAGTIYRICFVLAMIKFYL